MEHIVRNYKRRKVNPVYVIILAVAILLPCSTVGADETITEDAEQLDFAHGLFQRDLYDMAIAEYKNVIASFPESEYVHEAYFGIAESLLFSDLYEQAVEGYKLYLEKFPEGAKRATTKLRIGQSLFLLEKYDEALEYLTEIKEEDLPGNLVQILYFYTGKACKAKKDKANAFKYFDKVAEISEKSVYTSSAFFEAGGMLADDALYREALGYYVKSYDSAPADDMKNLALYKQAEMQFSSKNYDAAAEIFERVTREYPDYDIAQDALANRLLSLSNMDNHREVVTVYEDSRKLVGDDKRFFSVYYVAASAYAKLAKYDESLPLLDKGLSLEDLGEEDRHKALLKKANVLLEAKRFDEALAVLNTELKSAARDIDRIAFLKGEAYYELEDFKAAFAAYKQITDDFPESALADEALYSMGYAQQLAGNSREAIEIFLKYFQGGKDEAKRCQALYRILVIETKLGLTGQAIEHCETFLSTFKDSHLNENVMFQLGSLYSKSQSLEKAASVFKRFVREYEASKRLEEAYFLLAYNVQLSNNIEEALEYYQKVTPAKKELFYPALKNTAFIHLQQKNDEAAAEMLDRIITEFEDNNLDVGIYLWLARHYVDTDKFSDALRVLAKAESEKEIGDKREELAYLKAEPYRNMGECEKAIKQYDIVLSSGRDDAYTAASHIGKGLCLIATENYKNAESEFETVIREYPEDNTITMRARFEIADIKQRTGDLNEACRFYMLVAILYQDDNYCPEALYRAGELFEKLDKHSEARKAYQEIIDQYKESPQFEKAEAKLGNVSG